MRTSSENLLIWLTNQGKVRYRTFQLRYLDTPYLGARVRVSTGNKGTTFVLERSSEEREQ